MEDRNLLSLCLCNILERVGVSERIRQLHQNLATTSEILHTISWSYPVPFKNQKSTVFFCGSYCEGTVSPDLLSDIDIIVCGGLLLPLVVNADAAPLGFSHHMVIDSVTYPGYVKLQAIYKGSHCTESNFENNPIYELDYSGNAYLRCFPYKEIHGPSEEYSYHGIEYHGPAFIGRDSSGNHVIDGVLAYMCPSIPGCVGEWFTRTRRYGWPSQQQLNEMSKMGCMVVPVGSKSSTATNFEWRISFSLQEKLLMTSLNPIQHKVYVLLKMVKKRLLDQSIGTDFLTSYHCKTCLLYMCEMIPSTAWSAENLITCLILCLKLLLRCLRDRYCPNYFNKNQNLFKKDGIVSLRKPLIILIENLLKSGYHFLYSLDNDSLGLLLGGEIRFESITKGVTINDNVNKHILRLHLNCANIAANVPNLIVKASQSAPDDLAYFMGVLKDIHITNITHLNADQYKEAGLYMVSCLHLRIGMCLGCRALRCTKQTERTTLIESAECYFSLATSADLVKVRLGRITIRFQMGQYEECVLLLREVEQYIKECTVFACGCTYTHYLSDPARLHTVCRFIIGKSVSAFASKCVAYCMIILPSMSDLVVQPLQYEMYRSWGTPPDSRDNGLDFWFDWAVVDADVYLYFMQYLVCTVLNQKSQRIVAIDSIRSSIDLREVRLGHKETAFNLLGWMYMQEQLISEAVVCFIESWKLRPHHNAAKFHMRDLCTKLSSGKPLQNLCDDSSLSQSI